MNIIPSVNTIGGIIAYLCITETHIKMEQCNNEIPIEAYLQQKPQIPEPPVINEYVINNEVQVFKEFLEGYPESEHEEIRERLEYLRQYILNYPDYDGEEYFISEDAFNHYKWREDKIEHTGLSEEEFDHFEIMQTAISKLGLSPKPTFEFILYLWDKLIDKRYTKIKVTTADEIFKSLINRISDYPQDPISIDFHVGKKHFKFENQDFIKAFISYYEKSGILAGGLTETQAQKEREIDYILLHTLLTNLPIKQKKQKKGSYSQAERNFGLCVLWLIGSINHKKTDNPEVTCHRDSNGIFDKLMRDFTDHTPQIIK